MECSDTLALRLRQFEIDTGAAFNPIIQDKNKDGTPRDYKLDSLTNYGEAG